MEFVFILALIIGIIAVLVSEAGKKAGHSKKVSQYAYKKREYIMTRPEREFYRRLFNVFGKTYLIYPQVHLSTILDHRKNGQSWKGALSRIQRKSVDYVLCTTNFQVVAAIELDDGSHDSSERKVRDEFVEEICKDAGLPLARFRGKNLSDDQIRETVEQAISG